MLTGVVAIGLHAVVVSLALGAVLVALVFVATRALALRAATRHVLWSTVLLAIAVMPLVAIGTSVARATPAHPPHLVALPHPIPVYSEGSSHRPIANSAADNPRTSHGAPALSLPMPHLSHTAALAIAVVWALGALVGLVGLALSVARVRALKRRSSPLDGALADELPWLTALVRGREIYLRLSFEIETPVAIGFRRPVILIPTELATAEGLTAIEPLVLHEHAHLRRYDDWTNLVQRAIERVLWFNPLVWIVGRRIALEREIASDDAVVEKTGAAREYAASLWRLAREMRMPEHVVVAPGALLTRKQISVRIEQLLDANRSRLRRSPAAAFGVATAGLFAVAFVATSAPAVEIPAQPEAHRLIVIAEALPSREPSPAPSAAPASVAPTAPPSSAPTDVPTAAPEPAPRVSPSALRTPYLPESQRSTRARQIEAAKVHARAAKAQTEAARAHAEAAKAQAEAAKAQAEAAKAQEQGVRDALATPPNLGIVIAGNAAGHRRFDGARVSREAVASCVGCSFRHADLHGLNLSGIAMTGDDLTGANLSGANLSGAKLKGLMLNEADLRGVNLASAQIVGVDLTRAVLRHANLHAARLIGVVLSHADVAGANLSFARIETCDLSGVDFRGTQIQGMTISGSDREG